MEKSKDKTSRHFFVGRALVFVLILIGIIVVLTYTLGQKYVQYLITMPVGDSQDVVAFTIEPGESLDQINENLVQLGLLEHPLIFNYYLKKQHIDGQIQAGAYEVPKNVTMQQLAELLQNGTFDSSITVVEGLRQEVLETILGWYESNGASVDTMAVSDDFMTLTEGKEGQLFPDTYILPRDSDVSELVTLMTEHSQETLHTLYDASDTALSYEEALVLASLVEREARTDDSRKMVADILERRLANNWPLEVDATVQYALGYDSLTNTWWTESLTEADLQIDSPYNTRANLGLPPTPICNPSVSSFEAVLNPTANDYWFYLTGTDGQMYYAKNLEEHNSNIVNYLAS